MPYKAAATCLALLTIAMLALWASQEPDEVSENPGELLSEAREIMFQKGPEAALPLLRNVVVLYRTSGEREGEATALRALGACQRRLGKLEDALESLDSSLALSLLLEDTGGASRALNNRGLVYWELGRYPDAILDLDRGAGLAQANAEHRVEGAIRNNLALVFDELGDYRKSVEEYERSLTLYEEVDFPRGRSDTLGNIGGVHLLLGRYREAMGLYRRALTLSLSMESVPSMSQDLGNLARCYLALGDVESAEEFFGMASALARDAGLEKESADWLSGQGEIHLGRGEYDEAFSHYLQALETYERAGFQKEILDTLDAMGRLNLLLGDLTTAEVNFGRAADLAQEINHSLGYINSLTALAELEWSRQRMHEAGTLYREAADSARKADNRAQLSTALAQIALVELAVGRTDQAHVAAVESKLIAQELEAKPLEAQALFVLAEVERGIENFRGSLGHYREAAKKLGPVGDPEVAWRVAFGEGQALEIVQDRQGAVHAYQVAIEIIEKVRGQLRRQRFRAGYIQDRYEVYVALIRLLLEMGEPEQAFEYSGLLRAQNFLDLVQGGQTLDGKEIEDPALIELRGRIRRLREALEEEADRPRNEHRKQAVLLFSTELRTAEREYQGLIDDARSRPSGASVKDPPAPASQHVRTAVRPGSALLEYVVGKEQIIVFAVTEEGLRAKTTPQRRRDLRAKVELLRGLVARKDGDQWRQPSASLARSLWLPVENSGWLEGIQRVHVAPHGVLHYLPFSLLVREGTPDERLVLDDYILSYVPVAGDLHSSAIPSRQPVGLLAVAPERSRLAHAEEEAVIVTEMFPERHLMLLGPKAKESTFKTQAGGFDIIHIATHGDFNKLTPLLSGLELEPGDGEDGRLEVHEVLQLELSAGLVTLSACGTALGSGYFSELPPGNEFVGLTQAFLQAGSESVLASLWEINDRSTLDFMKSFYARLLDGDRAAALAETQRRILHEEGRFSHPFFWAAFVLVGSE